MNPPEVLYCICWRDVDGKKKRGKPVPYPRATLWLDARNKDEGPQAWIEEAP